MIHVCRALISFASLVVFILARVFVTERLYNVHCMQMYIERMSEGEAANLEIVLSANGSLQMN